MMPFLTLQKYIYTYARARAQGHRITRTPTSEFYKISIPWKHLSINQKKIFKISISFIWLKRFVYRKKVSIVFIISETLSGRLSFRKLRLADQLSGSFVFLITSLTDLTFNSCYLLSLAELGTIRTRGWIH